jgi:sensor histidine kinase YesM
MKSVFSTRNLLLSVFSTVIFNTAIAALLTMLGKWGGFWVNFIFSQCIGLSIVGLNILILRHVQPGLRRLVVMSLILPVAVAVGLTLAFFLSGVGSWREPYAWQGVLIGLFFGVIGSITFLLSERIQLLDAEVRRRRLIEMEGEKRAVEAHLRLLQAQIEPHFLFNTLANVSSLIEIDTTQARHLLDKLIDWLRVALARTRNEHATLGDELTLLENYLHILGMRFGNRLHWHIDEDDKLRAIHFPPLLLQPLVENAIRHGIEPKLGGGHLTISARREADKLVLRVEDDGVGFADNIRSGAGLENVRSRLQALYGAAASVTLRSNASGGVSSILELPL